MISYKCVLNSQFSIAPHMPHTRSRIKPELEVVVLPRGVAAAAARLVWEYCMRCVLRQFHLVFVLFPFSNNRCPFLLRCSYIASHAAAAAAVCICLWCSPH